MGPLHNIECGDQVERLRVLAVDAVAHAAKQARLASVPRRCVVDEEKRTITAMVSKVAYAVLLLAPPTSLPRSKYRASSGESSGSDRQPYGVRDRTVREPAGNLLRVQGRAAWRSRVTRVPAGSCRGRLHPLPRGSHARLTLRE